MTGTFAKPASKGGEPGRRTEMSKTVIGIGQNQPFQLAPVDQNIKKQNEAFL